MQYNAVMALLPLASRRHLSGTKQAGWRRKHCKHLPFVVPPSSVVTMKLDGRHWLELWESSIWLLVEGMLVEGMYGICVHCWSSRCTQHAIKCHKTVNPSLLIVACGLSHCLNRSRFIKLVKCAPGLWRFTEKKKIKCASDSDVWKLHFNDTFKSQWRALSENKVTHGWN